MPHTETKSDKIEIVFQSSSTLRGSRAISAAARLRLADLMDGEPVTIARLAADAGARPDMLGRLMDRLTSFGIFVRTPDGRFGHNETSLHLRNDHPASQRAIVEPVFGPELDEACLPV